MRVVCRDGVVDQLRSKGGSSAMISADTWMETGAKDVISPRWRPTGPARIAIVVLSRWVADPAKTPKDRGLTKGERPKVVLADSPPERKLERGYIRMFPRNENRNKSTFACSPGKPERGYIRQNHPFTKPPFCLSVKRNLCEKLPLGTKRLPTWLLFQTHVF